MGFDWFAVLLGWVGGIPSGLIANWLYHKLSKKKQPRGNYFTATYSSDSMDFEGHVNAHMSIEEIVRNLIKPVNTEPKDGNKST